MGGSHFSIIGRTEGCVQSLPFVIRGTRSIGIFGLLAGKFGESWHIDFGLGEPFDLPKIIAIFFGIVIIPLLIFLVGNRFKLFHNPTFAILLTLILYFIMIIII